MTAPDVAAAVARLREDLTDTTIPGVTTVGTPDLALVLDDHARLTAPPVVGEALVERLAEVAYSAARADKIDRVGPDAYMPWERLGVNARSGWHAAARAVVAALPDPVAVVEGVDLAGVLREHCCVDYQDETDGAPETSEECDCGWVSVHGTPSGTHRQHQADMVRAAVVAALRGKG